MAKRKYKATPQNNPQIEEPKIIIPTGYKYAYVIPKGTSRKEIKDLAADLAYEGIIPNPTAEEDPNAPTYRTIDDYEKLNTREHRILHRAHDRFKAKDERTELKSLPTEEHSTPARRVIKRKRVKETYKPYIGEIRQADPFDPVILSMRSRQNALEFAKNHPYIDKLLHFIPIVNGAWTYSKTDPTSPRERHAMGAAFVQDAISLSGLGLAAKAIGSVPALSTELGGIAGAYGGNIGGEYLVNKYGAPNWVQDAATFLGGSVGGAAGSFAGNVYRNYRTLKNYNEIGYTGVPGKRVDGDPNAPRMSDVAKDYKGVMWTTPTKGYAKLFAESENGKVFKVLVNNSNLKVAEAPRAAPGTYFPWTDLPYEFKNGKFVFKNNASIWSEKSVVFPDEATALSSPNYKDAGLRQHSASPEGIYDRLPGNTRSSTNSAVKSAFGDGYDVVKLYNIFDGGYPVGNRYVNVPINETIINAGVPRLTLDLGESKWKHLMDWDLYKKLNP